MSLINQALKKAQHDRSGRPEPEKAAEAPAGPAYPPVVRPRTGLLFTLVAIGTILVIGAGALFFLSVREIAPADATPGESSAAERPAATPQAEEPKALEPIAPPSIPLAAPQAPASATPPVASESGTSTTTPPTATPPSAAPPLPDPEAEALARAAAQISSTAADGSPAEGDPRVIRWLAATQVTGARVSDSGGRVLLDNDAFAVGETVSYTLGLRVVAVEAGRVAFEDKRGVRYIKRY